MIDFDGQLYVNARGWRLAYNVLAVAWLWLRRGVLCRHVWQGERCSKCGAWNGPHGWYFE